MLDTSIRDIVSPTLSQLASAISRTGLRANHITIFGFFIGVGACVAVVVDQWLLGLALWAANRILDGLDGALARKLGTTEFGGFLDIMADFAIYAGIVVAIGISEPSTRVVALATLLAYYLNGAAFLAWSSLAERLRLGETDGRSLHFPTGLAEGSETIAAMCLVLAFRAHAVTILWIWVAIVSITVVQRLIFVSRRLRHGLPGQEATEQAA